MILHFDLTYQNSGFEDFDVNSPNVIPMTGDIVNVEKYDEAIFRVTERQFYYDDGKLKKVTVFLKEIE